MQNNRVTSDEGRWPILIISRLTSGSDKFVIYKTLLLVVGLAFFLVGIGIEQSWPVWVALGFVGVAFLLRFLPGSTESEERGTKSEERRVKRS